MIAMTNPNFALHCQVRWPLVFRARGITAGRPKLLALLRYVMCQAIRMNSKPSSYGSVIKPFNNLIERLIINDIN